MAIQNSQNNQVQIAQAQSAPLMRANTKKLDELIMQDITGSIESGAIHLFPEYSASDAIKAAIIKIGDATTYEGKYALDVCTRRSVFTALRNMVYQGLDPSKNQCYFIPRFNRDKGEWSLDLMRSYFGTVVATKRLCPEIADINAQVIHQGDTYRIEIDDHGNMIVKDHNTVLENLDKPIIAAYAKVFGKDGELITAGVMSWSELQKSWGQSSNRGWQQPNSVQSKFPQEMAKRTILNRVCKMMVNSSTDKALMVEAYKSTTENEYMRDVTPKATEKVTSGGAQKLAERLARKKAETMQASVEEEATEAPEAPEASGETLEAETEQAPEQTPAQTEAPVQAEAPAEEDAGAVGDDLEDDEPEMEGEYYGVEEDGEEGDR